MSSDIRVKTSFWHHRKTRKLKQCFRDAGPAYIIRLWSMAADDRPKGILTGYDEADIASSAGYDGDAHEFVRGLLDIGFLDQNEDGTYAIHNWQKHQGFAYYAEERSLQAKEAARIRWEKKSQKQNADGMRDACKPHANRNAPSPIPNPKPNPIPSPAPAGEREDLFSSKNRVENNSVDPDVQAVIDHFKASVREVVGIDAETSDIDARLTEHALTKYKADELNNLVDFCIDYSHSKDWAVSLGSYYKPIFKNLYAKEWQKKKGLFYGYENPPLNKRWWR